MDQATNMSRVAMRVKFLDPEPYGHAGEEFAPATSGSAGIDLRACIKEAEVVIEPGDRLAVPSGVAIEVMVPGVAGFVYSRSGLGAKDGVTVSQGVGVIDPDYRGEIKVFLTNTSKEPKTVTRGQRIAQLILQPFFRAEVEAVDELGGTDRGAGGFGHTGRM